MELRTTQDALHDLRHALMLEAERKVVRHKALEMAHLSLLAYELDLCGPDALDELLRRGAAPLSACYELVGVIANPEEASGFVETVRPRGYVARSGDEIVIAIKGSVDAYDWFGINIGSLSPRSIDLHAGYALLGEWVWKQLSELMSIESIRELKRISVAGHSLGGAVALVAGTVLANALEEPGAVPIQAYSFAAPAVHMHRNAAQLLRHDRLTTYQFLRPTDMVAGFGLFPDEWEPGFLLGKEGEIYLFDGSRDAQIIYIFEIIRALLEKARPSGHAALGLVLFRLRDAVREPICLEDEILLDPTVLVHNLPGITASQTEDILAWFKSQHHLQQYMAALRERGSAPEAANHR